MGCPTQHSLNIQWLQKMHSISFFSSINLFKHHEDVSVYVLCMHVLCMYPKLMIHNIKKTNYFK